MGILEDFFLFGVYIFLVFFISAKLKNRLKSSKRIKDRSKILLVSSSGNIRIKPCGLLFSPFPPTERIFG